MKEDEEGLFKIVANICPEEIEPIRLLGDEIWASICVKSALKFEKPPKDCTKDEFYAFIKSIIRERRQLTKQYIEALDDKIAELDGERSESEETMRAMIARKVFKEGFTGNYILDRFIKRNTPADRRTKRAKV